MYCVFMTTYKFIPLYKPYRELKFNTQSGELLCAMIHFSTQHHVTFSFMYEYDLYVILQSQLLHFNFVRWFPKSRSISLLYHFSCGIWFALIYLRINIVSRFVRKKCSFCSDIELPRSPRYNVRNALLPNITLKCAAILMGDKFRNNIANCQYYQNTKNQSELKYHYKSANRAT